MNTMFVIEVLIYSQIQPRQTLKKLPLQANVYPMSTMAYIQDIFNRLTLHAAQPLGIGSLRNGKWIIVLDLFFTARLLRFDNVCFLEVTLAKVMAFLMNWKLMFIHFKCILNSAA